MPRQESRPTVLLCILDGWGLPPEMLDPTTQGTVSPTVRLDHPSPHSAINPQTAPCYFEHLTSRPWVMLETSGMAVGLPDGQMGNSEVGHMTIGSGRRILSDLVSIDDSIATQAFKTLPAWKDAVTTLKQSGGHMHLLGLLSDGGVHAHLNHIAAYAQAFSEEGIPVLIHAITDGRDTAPDCAEAMLTQFQAVAPAAEIVTVQGRFFAMDRDKRFERTQAAFNLIAWGEANHSAASVTEAVRAARQRGETDEFIAPTRIGAYAGIQPQDGLLCCNFRSDRMKQMLAVLVGNTENTNQFERSHPKKGTPYLVKIAFVGGFRKYGPDVDPCVSMFYPDQNIQHTLGQEAAAFEKTQLRIAETEKFSHVTWFFDGGRDEELKGAERTLLPSPKVRTYDLQPEMSAHEIKDRIVQAIHNQEFDLIIANFANADMVGHTGKLDAAKQAIQTVDACLREITDALRANKGVALVTADHGNAEIMVNQATGKPHTAHTNGPVPAILIDFAGGWEFIMPHAENQPATTNDGKPSLVDIAPTLLAFLHLPVPKEMTGQPLFKQRNNA